MLYLYDGEITTAKVDYVDAEFEDIIVTVFTSNQHYERPGERAFTIRAAHIQRLNTSEA